jgi:hypothetical protein
MKLEAGEPVVSREQAIELATAVAGKMGRTVGSVRDLADFDRARREVGTPVNYSDAVGRFPCLYGLDLSNCWIAYLAPPPGRFGLFSSDIVVIDKKTGAVRYIGSANDEG